MQQIANHASPQLNLVASWVGDRSLLLLSRYGVLVTGACVQKLVWGLALSRTKYGQGHSPSGIC